MSFFRKSILLVLATFATFSAASAGVLREDKSDTDWEFIIAPYFWLSSISGDANGIPVDAEFKDLLKELNIALSLHSELHRGKWGIIFDPMYLQLEMDVDVPAPENPTIRADIWLVELLGAYKFTPNWEVYAGARYSDQTLKITRGDVIPVPPAPGILPESFKIGENWTNWIAGVRATYPLGDKWLFTGKLDGAFAGDSKKSWNAVAMFNYRIRKTMALNLGYRYYVDEFDNKKSGLEKYTWDIKQQGPVIGYTWAF